jgi:hypothetical protein
VAVCESRYSKFRKGISEVSVPCLYAPPIVFQQT